MAGRTRLLDQNRPGAWPTPSILTLLRDHWEIQTHAAKGTESLCRIFKT